MKCSFIAFLFFCVICNIIGQGHYQFKDNNNLIKQINDVITIELQDIENYQLFFIGEHHDRIDVSIDKIIIDELIKLDKNFDIIYEIPHSQAYLINNYLKYDDELVFETFRDSSLMWMAFELNSIRKLKVIYDNSRIKFKIIGFEFNNYESKYSYSPQLALRDICKKTNVLKYEKKIPTALVTLIDILEIEEENYIHYKGRNKTLRKLSSKIYKSDYSTYKEIFGLYFFDFIRIIEDVSIGAKYKTIKKATNRDDFLFSRVEKVLIENPNKFYLARYGAFHVSKTRIKGRKQPSLAELLVNADYKVKSIIIIPSYTPTYSNFPSFFEKDEWSFFCLIMKKRYSKKISKMVKIYFDNNSELEIVDKQTTSLIGVDFVLFLNSIPIRCVYN